MTQLDVSADDRPVPSPEHLEFFEAHVRPLLVEHCYACHSTDAKELKGGFYVDSLEAMLGGGESGPAVIAGDPEHSLLMQAVRFESLEMPPDKKLRDSEIAALQRWIEMGAPWPEAAPKTVMQSPPQEIDWNAARNSHWAWRPVNAPPIPQLSSPSRNAIDAFVIAQRAAMDVRAVQPATTNALARRIYLDLIGIIPTAQQVEEFVVAASGNRQMAVETLVNSLLDSPLYGQRWGRHWLDVARYSDGGGGFLDNDTLPDAWRYRDWVVNAFNQDMPYDRFLTLQLAGDLIGNQEEAIATGYFALGPTYRSDGGDPESIAQAKGETLDDRVDTFTRGMLGVTGSCARCHDHKFDPIPQVDYYSLAGIFNNSESTSRPLAETKDVEAFLVHKKSVDEISAKIKKLTKPAKNPKNSRTPAAEVDEPVDEQLKFLQAELDDLNVHAPPGYDAAHILQDIDSSDMHVAIRGNLLKQGIIAPRGMLRIVSGRSQTSGEGSGRIALAAALVDPSNPLTARVIVNRVWQQHFGRGLVFTPSNFGSLGEPPSHPELLDWLANEFVRSGWSLKWLHRIIITSDTFQLSSQHSEASFRADGENRWLWRFSPRRMDVEVWRDSLLSLTGDLDTSLGGPSIAEIAESNRRTLYAKVSRNGDQFASDEFLRRFDFPMMRATVAKRPVSIVPQQYLFLLNSNFMIQRAQRLAALLNESSPASDEARIRTAYRWLYQREPQPEELRLALEFLKGAPVASSFTAGAMENTKLSVLEQYSQVLLGSNEFMFVR